MSVEVDVFFSLLIILLLFIVSHLIPSCLVSFFFLFTYFSHEDYIYIYVSTKPRSIDEAGCFTEHI